MTTSAPTSWLLCWPSHAGCICVGGIGSEAARLLSAFGVTVLGTDARRTTAPDGVAELHRPEALDELLPRADFVILTVPHTPATEGFFDRARFQRMKPTAFFINIGRGMTTKLDDLVTVLEAGEIAGAALDVYEEEPLPSDHRLWTLPNVLLTPHMAGHGPYLNDRRFQIIVDNCRAFAGVCGMWWTSRLGFEPGCGSAFRCGPDQPQDKGELVPIPVVKASCSMTSSI